MFNFNVLSVRRHFRILPDMYKRFTLTEKRPTLGTLRHTTRPLTRFAVLGRSPDWMLGVQSGERSRVENVRTYGRGVLVYSYPVQL